MSYYDREAPVYDETRGGVERAKAAARAITEVAPAGGRLLDVAGGTGIITAELAGHGFDVVVTDLSQGMLRLAADRLPGRACRADATRFPVRSASVDVVTTIWLLHLLPPDRADQVIAEAARVLRPDGCFVTTVDKHQAHGRPPESDADSAERVAAVARAHDLTPGRRTSFRGETVWASGQQGQVFAVASFVR